jgi:HSP20 family protein
MLDVEQAIREVGAVYQALTGRPIEVGKTPLPPEIDARAAIEDRYRQLKSLLESPFAGAAMPFGGAWTPAMEVVERELEVRCELDLPAVARGDVTIGVMGDALVVRGRRGGVNGNGNGGAVRWSEHAKGPFQRVIPLPPRARRDGITAALKDGVLTIVIPTDGPSGSPQTIDVR